ncbi:MAG: hypothetical protein IPK32_09875 [Verrucomicrobiaceae bacterium]|nr:hypothetical protein [Verrucomicrobiaceae bacterium]
MKKIICSIITLAALTQASRAGMIISYAEDPNTYVSTLSGTQVFDFNSITTGKSTNVNWSGVGTFDQLYVKNADAYGGAADALNPNGTRYSVQGAGSGVLSSTLNLSNQSAYFGLWWSAGDAKNVLEFYNGSTLVGRFVTSTLMDPLPSTYDGNPRNRTINSHEPYGFINFFADENTTWDRIVFTNNGTSGFESDNYTTRVAAWNPLTDGALPGVPVAVVSGTTTTSVTSSSLEGSRWSLNESSVGAIPGAPAPPWILLAAFAVVVTARRSKLTPRMA